ncbi:MAG: acyltransferase family protein [Bacilli bacterium]
MKKQVEKNLDIKERETGLDILRGIAVIFVLSVHFLYETKYYSTALAGKSMYLQAMLRNIFMICVPMFMTITGYFNKEKLYNKKFFKKLFGVIVVWLFYSVIEFIYKNNNNMFNIKVLDFVNSILSFNACHYSWYINMYIGLFLLSPILNLAFDAMDQSQQKRLIIVIVGITLFSNVFNEILGIGIIYPQWWSCIYPVAYYFIGKYINRYKPTFPKRKIITTLIVINFALLIFVVLNSKGPVVNTGTETIGWNSLPNAINTVCVFLLFYDVKIKSKIISVPIKYISKLSLDIYLASSLIDIIVYKQILNLDNMTQQQIFPYYPIIISMTFTGSLLLGIIRTKLIKLR